MKTKRRHRWDFTPTEAVALQKRLAAKAQGLPAPRISQIKAVLGVDVAYSRRTDTCYAAAVAIDIRTMRTIEQRTAASPSRYPYVPGLLSFREIPALVPALRRIKSKIDVIICDSQGIAHQRRFGLAVHLGWLYGIPSLGCAKSRLIGEYDEPGETRGSYTDLVDGREKIGEVLRTRDNVKPLFVSPGYRMTFALARRLTLQLGAGLRLPEPTRLAHLATARAYAKNELRTFNKKHSTSN